MHQNVALARPIGRLCLTAPERKTAVATFNRERNSRHRRVRATRAAVIPNSDKLSPISGPTLSKKIRSIPEDDAQNMNLFCVSPRGLSVAPIGIPEQKFNTNLEAPFPWVVGPTSCEAESWSSQELASFIRMSSKEIQRGLDRHGAILFRGFGLSTPEDFAAVVKAFAWEPFPYVGGNAVRTNVVGDYVFTANEAPSHRQIPFHHELAQTPSYPTKVLFFCQVPAESGGATPIVQSNIVYERLQALHPDFIEQVESYGVRYVRTMSMEDREASAIGRGWKNTLNVDTKKDAESKLQEMGCEWEWLSEDHLKQTSPILPAVKHHEPSGCKQFFNQVVAAYNGWQDELNAPGQAVVDGRGLPLNEEAVGAAANIMDEECVAFKYQVGDVLLLDNLTVMHSRHSFTGPRRILASLLK
ncbi:hypothetical protein CYMTET_55686 [Cymbomonas tetramitiformis]|uniref:TauD/TfdA-like domain-containing protein n=1 Tax=Cymbomonas tetramitiformis TaxID=36881 RepID=A0AAE0BDV9_9CHLO|nr:hypothetical protein CYMTET_55686 [Cymbomonas tetramitiformis]